MQNGFRVNTLNYCSKLQQKWELHPYLEQEDVKHVETLGKEEKYAETNSTR